MFYFDVKIHRLFCWLTMPGEWGVDEEEEVFIFSWLSMRRADWNGLAFVYKFFWSDPSLWALLSWPWPLGKLALHLSTLQCLVAAVFTVCHVSHCQSCELKVLPLLITTLPFFLHIFFKECNLAQNFYHSVIWLWFICFSYCTVGVCISVFTSFVL